MKRAVGPTRFIVGIGSLSSLVMGTLRFITAALVVLFRLLDFNLVLGNPKTTKERVVAAVEHADTVLIASRSGSRRAITTSKINSSVSWWAWPSTFLLARLPGRP